MIKDGRYDIPRRAAQATPIIRYPPHVSQEWRDKAVGNTKNNKFPRWPIIPRYDARLTTQGRGLPHGK
jgi:hypothetical protein